MHAQPQETAAPTRGRDPLLGTVLAGTRLEAILGEGAASRVYRGSHEASGRPLAVKVLSAAAATNPALVERFRREAEALARMRHPHVVQVVDSGTTPLGRPFLLMELLEGRTLLSVIEAEAPLLPGRIGEIGAQLAAGLAEAHRHGLVHRDLKPSNVILIGGAEGERAKILDFGIARLVDGRPRLEITAREALLGTPRYMAPEQVMSPTEVGPAADLYALGVILYELLAGRVPFEGGVMEVLEQQLTAAPPPLPTDSGLEPLVLQLLARDPRQRPSSAEAVRDAIWAATEPVAAGPSERPTVRPVSVLSAWSSALYDTAEQTPADLPPDGPRDGPRDGSSPWSTSSAAGQAEVTTPEGERARARAALFDEAPTAEHAPFEGETTRIPYGLSVPGNGGSARLVVRDLEAPAPWQDPADLGDVDTAFDGARSPLEEGSDPQGPVPAIARAASRPHPGPSDDGRSAPCAPPAGSAYVDEDPTRVPAPRSSSGAALLRPRWGALVALVLLGAAAFGYVLQLRLAPEEVILRTEDLPVIQREAGAELR